MDKKRPSSKRYPSELKERAVRMVPELRLEDCCDHVAYGETVVSSTRGIDHSSASNLQTLLCLTNKRKC
jgi:hypothetical protein